MSNWVGEEAGDTGGLNPLNTSTTDGFLFFKKFLYLPPINA